VISASEKPLRRATPWLRHALLLWIGLLIACAPAAGRAPSDASLSNPAAQSGTPKRITVAIRAEPATLYTKVVTITTSVPGLDAVEDLIHAGLAIEATDGVARAQLGETMPTAENGRWRIFPDGRMETEWTLRPGALWHDGTPITAEDVVFTSMIARDPALPTFSDVGYGFLDRVEARDDRTVVIHWNRPYIAADMSFSRDTGYPLPRHLLESQYRENAANFQMIPHWTDEFVGSGPFKVREFQRGSHLLLDAHPGYALGRPRLDGIEVKFMPNTSTMSANVLAGVVEVTLGRTLSLEEGEQIRDRWPDGRMDAPQNILIRLYSQMQDPQPAILGNVEFRRALVHGMNRQQLIDAFQGGLTTVAHTIMPSQPRFAEIEASVRKYNYDPARATQIVEGLGYTRGPDRLLRDSAGRPLAPIEVRSPATSDLQTDLIHAISKDWEAIGIPTELVLVPLARNSDREYRTTRPAFHTVGGPQGLDGISRMFHSSEIPSARTRWTGNNAARWHHPEVDALVDRYLVTIPEPERMRLVGQIVRIAADELPLLPLFFNVEPTMIANRVLNVTGRSVPATQAWNAHEWDVR
jgi:peptide/nickel transport system substrate-binding protein